MAQVLLISPDYVYQNTAVNTSVEATKITPFIRLAQDKWLEPSLGTRLIDKIKTDGSGISGNYLTLRDDYIRPALVWFTLQEMLPSLNFKIDNGAIAQHNSDNTQAVGVTEMNRLVQDAKNNAAFYDGRLKDYLCNNSSLFPEYNQNTGSDVQPNGKYTQMFAFSGNNHDMTRNNSQSKLNRFLP